MQIPESWDKDQSPYKALKLLDEKLTSFDEVFRRIIESCSLREKEIDKRVDEVAERRKRLQEESSQWQREYDAFCKSIDDKMRKIAGEEAKQEDLTDEEKKLLEEGSPDDGICGFEEFMKKYQEQQKTGDKKQDE